MTRSRFYRQLRDLRVVVRRQAVRQALDGLPVRVGLSFVEARRQPCRDSTAHQHLGQARSQPSNYAHPFYAHPFSPERTLAAAEELDCGRGRQRVLLQSRPLSGQSRFPAVAAVSRSERVTIALSVKTRTQSLSQRPDSVTCPAPLRLPRHAKRAGFPNPHTASSASRNLLIH
jgi:hypothetical protein